MANPLNFSKFFTKFGKEFGEVGEKEVAQMLESSGVKIAEGKILGHAAEDGAVTGFTKHQDVLDHYKNDLAKKADSVIPEAVSPNSPFNMNIEQKRGVDYFPKNETKFSDSEISKLRKDQDAFNKSKGNVKNDAQNRDFDFSNTRQRESMIANERPDYNHKENLNQSILNDRMSRPTGDSNYATNRGATIKKSAFNDSGAMDNYNKKNNIANITSEEGAKQRELKEALGRKHAESKKVRDESAGAAATEKGNAGKMDSFLKQAIPITVGGGLIFSMFGRGGQMSNSELYGQQKAYGQ